MTYKFNRKYFTEDQITEYLHNLNNVVVLNITSKDSDKTSMCPVWMVYDDGTFYFPSQRSALRIKLVEQGDVHAGLIVVDPRYFPEIQKGHIPYVTVLGDVKVHYPGEFSDYARIIALYFTKFNYEELSTEEIEEISARIANESVTSCILEFVPRKNFIREVLEKEN